MAMTLRESVNDKAAVLLESMIRNHALVDGNKRLGWLALVVFYGLNDVELDAPDDDVYDLVIAVATGEPAYQDVAITLGSWRSPAEATRQSPIVQES